ncbi:MAG: hypothetical protein HY865_10270 [Chloroflexi bacterium]|nr:hypothetical protein [Chloroflexota bacterium]
MAVFQQIFWGYELTYPDGWVCQPQQDADAFAATADAIDPSYSGADAGQLLVRGEWNWELKPIGPLWHRHIGMLAGMMGARQVGSAPWKIGQSVGLEAEIVLPKRENRRLWTGILAHDFRVLHFMVTHPREARDEFQPVATKIISSLRFPNQISGVETSPESVPLPPGYESVDPKSILPDIAAPEQWRAYAGSADIGALQAFYAREAPLHGWAMEEYIPFPGASELGFARLKLRGKNLELMVGLMPGSVTETPDSSSPANIVWKIA